MRLSEVPIIQAPMAGGPSTPALAAAVGRAGGYGFVAGGYLSADGLREVVGATRQLTAAPLGVNLCVPSPPRAAVPVGEYAASLELEADRLGVGLGVPRWDDDDFDAKLEVVETAPVDLVSFTFGCPSPQTVDRLHRKDRLVAVTVTSGAEADMAEEAGVDVLVVQGTEAGGHQGGFLDLRANRRTLLTLLSEIGHRTGLPLVGSGGVMTGSALARVLGAGAVAVQAGTVFLCTPEAGTSAAHRRALLDRRYPGTMVTRAFSGRYARGLANEFAVAHHRRAPEAYPEVHHLTRPLRVAATEAGDPGVPNLWAGTGWRGVTTEPAEQVVRRMTAEARRLGSQG